MHFYNSRIELKSNILLIMNINEIDIDCMLTDLNQRKDEI
jgi:hypothetical protein